MDFEAIVDKHEKSIYNLIYRIVGDLDEAADLTQETFIAAYKSIKDFRGDSSVYTWLYKIAINKCKNAYKYKSRLEKIESISLDDNFEYPSDIPGPDSELASRELKELIDNAMKSLPFEYKIVSVLRDIHGFSYQEIADVTELSVDVVRTRLARARMALRRKLGHYFEP